jgi:hypothetical protein
MAVETGGAYDRRAGIAKSEPAGQDCGSANATCRADASERPIDRRHRHFSSGSSSIHRQADRTPDKLRRPSRHRHRKHTAAQRIARIAAAADRHFRRPQGHQPLDLRSTDSARYADRIGRPSLRGRQGCHLSAGRRLVSARRKLRVFTRSGAVRARSPPAGGPG